MSARALMLVLCVTLSSCARVPPPNTSATPAPTRVAALSPQEAHVERNAPGVDEGDACAATASAPSPSAFVDCTPSFVLEARLYEREPPSAPTHGDSLGYRLAWAGSTLWASDPSRSRLVAYERDSQGRWAPALELRSTPEKHFGDFGIALSVADGLVAVGSSKYPYDASGQGAVFVWRSAELQSDKASIITAPDGYREFGRDVLASARWLAIDSLDAEGDHALHLYRITERDFLHTHTLELGHADRLAFDGKTLVVIRHGVVERPLREADGPVVVVERPSVSVLVEENGRFEVRGTRVKPTDEFDLAVDLRASQLRIASSARNAAQGDHPGTEHEHPVLMVDDFSSCGEGIQHTQRSVLAASSPDSAATQSLFLLGDFLAATFAHPKKSELDPLQLATRMHRVVPPRLDELAILDQPVPAALLRSFSKPSKLVTAVAMAEPYVAATVWITETDSMRTRRLHSLGIVYVYRMQCSESP